MQISTSQNALVRKATWEDFPEIWKIFHEVVKGGDTYPYDPNITQEQAEQLWFAPAKHVYVAVLNDAIVGTYYLTANQPGLGSHVGNAGYMVSPHTRGAGIGRTLCAHSLEEAKRLGFLAIQYNYVVSTNKTAVALWQKMGFQIIGTTPKGFKHSTLGYVDTYIMHRFV